VLRKNIIRQHPILPKNAFRKPLFWFFCTFFFFLNTSAQEKRMLAETPPMGWNSWNWFGKNQVSEEVMKQCMDAMVEEGLLEAGYEYFVIDGGWRDTKLGSNGREILFSISARHPDNEWQSWFPEIGQMARTTDDIKARVSGGAVFDHIPHRSVLPVAEENSRWAEYAGNGYWNDPDILAVGDQGLTPEEQKVHFALWCIMSAPLILGNDPRNMTPEEKKLVTNKLAIAINQDPSEQGKRIRKEGAKEIWAKRLTNGDLAILLLNRGDKRSKRIKVSPAELEISEKAKIQDVFSEEKMEEMGKSFSARIQPHEGYFLLIRNGTE
jgi:hypothetical protein